MCDESNDAERWSICHTCAIIRLPKNLVVLDACRFMHALNTQSNREMQSVERSNWSVREEEHTYRKSVNAQRRSTRDK